MPLLIILALAYLAISWAVQIIHDHQDEAAREKRAKDFLAMLEAKRPQAGEPRRLRSVS